MNLETASSGVLFVAAFEEADEGLHARVRQLMRLQVTLGDELLAALAASEGSLARVRPHVSLEDARLLELLQTALERTNQELNFIFWPFDSLDCCRDRICQINSTLQKGKECTYTGLQIYSHCYRLYPGSRSMTRPYRRPR